MEQSGIDRCLSRSEGHSQRPAAYEAPEKIRSAIGWEPSGTSILLSPTGHTTTYPSIVNTIPAANLEEGITRRFPKDFSAVIATMKVNRRPPRKTDFYRPEYNSLDHDRDVTDTVYYSSQTLEPILCSVKEYSFFSDEARVTMILKWMRFYRYQPNIEKTTDKHHRGELKTHLKLPKGFGQKLAIFIITKFNKMTSLSLIAVDEEKQTVEYHATTNQMLDQSWDGNLERLVHDRSTAKTKSSNTSKPLLKRPNPYPLAQVGKRQRSGSVPEPNSDNTTNLASVDKILPSTSAESPKSLANRASLKISPNSFIIRDEEDSPSDSNQRNPTEESSQPETNGHICSDRTKETTMKHPLATPGVPRPPNNNTTSSNRLHISETSEPIEPILKPSLPRRVLAGSPSRKEPILKPSQPSGFRASSPPGRKLVLKASQPGGIRAGSPSRPNLMPDHNLLSAELEKIIANSGGNSAENGSKDDRTTELKQYKGELSILKGIERICRKELEQKKRELRMVSKAYKQLVVDYSDLKDEIKRYHQVVTQATERNKFIVPPTPSGTSQSTFAQTLLEVQKKTEDDNWKLAKQAEKLQLEAKMKVQSDKKSTLKTVVAEKTAKLKDLHAEIKEKKEQDARNRSLAAGLGAFLDEFMDVEGSGTTSPAESLSDPESELSDLSDSDEN
jgi:hypothetical protein